MSVNFIHNVDFLALDNAAGVEEINAEVIDEFVFDRLAESPLVVEILAGAQRHVGVRTQVA